MESKKLKETFDKNRKVDSSRLEVLKSMGLNPQFEEACIRIFEEMGATVPEVIGAKEEIKKQDKNLKRGLLAVNTKRYLKFNKQMINSATDD